MLLADKYPFLTNYFETGINNKLNNHGVPISHSLVFYGQDIDSQYTIALEIARQLNCTGDLSDDCQCLNCKWIREHKHPAVLTISRVDNKPQDDDSKTVISIKQSNMIKNMLITSSQFHRVFIFCDKDDNDNICGLNHKNFQEEAANSLLKMIEEPNDKILFIFLVTNKEDILTTIISRSQCFNISKKESDSVSYNNIKLVFENYWQFERSKAYEVSQNLFDLTKHISPKELLQEMQNYVFCILKENPDSTDFINDFKCIEKAKQELNADIKLQSILDDLCLHLIK